ncbi:hypothetical protein Tco_0536453 [Tanacetum coccineum]
MGMEMLQQHRLRVMIAQEEEAGTHLTLEEFNFMADAEAAKFVRDFKSLANEADESLAKHKALEFDVKRLLQAIVSQDVMSIVQNPTVVESSDLLSLNIKRLQAQLGDLKGKSKDTSCVSYSLKPLSQKLENENVELEFQSLVRQPNAFQSERPISSKTRVPPKVVESNDLSNRVTSNSVPITKASNVVKNDNVIAPGMFRINPFKTSREDKFVPINKARASVMTNPITVSQPHVITKKDVNSVSGGFSPKDIECC